MPPDRNLRLGQTWTFRLVNAPVQIGTWWFAWEVHDSSGNTVLKSNGSFETLSECVEDAKQNGYVEPESRT